MKINPHTNYIEINNTTNSPIEDGFFEAVAKKSLAGSGYDFLNPPAGRKKINISLALVSPQEIRELNNKYREYDSVTDVLSFPEYENIGQIEKAVAEKPGGELFLGELILCYDDIKEYAEKEKLSLKEELANVLSHGILHLLGFKHGKEMFKIQNEVKSHLI